MNLFGFKKEGGKAVIYIHNCIGCGACIARCNKGALGYYEIGNERFAKLLHPDRCTGCGKCAKVCENDAIEITNLIPCRI